MVPDDYSAKSIWMHIDVGRNISREIGNGIATSVDSRDTEISLARNMHTLAFGERVEFPRCFTYLVQVVVGQARPNVVQVSQVSNHVLQVRFLGRQANPATLPGSPSALRRRECHETVDMPIGMIYRIVLSVWFTESNIYITPRRDSPIFLQHLAALEGEHPHIFRASF